LRPAYAAASTKKIIVPFPTGAPLAGASPTRVLLPVVGAPPLLLMRRLYLQLSRCHEKESCKKGDFENMFHIVVVLGFEMFEGFEKFKSSNASRSRGQGVRG
jgi:hypothetical protein